MVDAQPGKTTNKVTTSASRRRLCTALDDEYGTVPPIEPSGIGSGSDLSHDRGLHFILPDNGALRGWPGESLCRDSANPGAGTAPNRRPSRVIDDASGAM